MTVLVVAGFFVGLPYVKVVLGFFLLISGLTQAQSADTIYTFVDEPAKIPEEYNKWFAENVKFTGSLFYLPDDMPSCTFLFTFIIEKDGTVSDVDVDFDGTSEQEAYIEQLYLKMPRWTPAKIKGQAVRSRYSMRSCIRFAY